MTPTECTCPLARHRHGTRAMYQRCGCRCYPCRSAAADEQRRRRHRIQRDRTPAVQPAVGTRRRIEALHAAGWSGAQLGARLGLTHQGVWQCRMGPYVYPGTAERVARLYDELWDQPAAGMHVVKVKNWAARQGFAPPLAWDDDSIDDPAATPADPPPCDQPDDVAVQRIMHGTLRLPAAARSPERIEAIRRLAAAGHNNFAIARRVGMSQTAVMKTRQRHGIPSPVRRSA
jgi:hypothetical protein